MTIMGKTKCRLKASDRKIKLLNYKYSIKLIIEVVKKCNYKLTKK